MADCYGDYGLTGVVTVETRGGRRVVEDFVMSCRVLGRRAYPYALLRAHEIAVVSYEEKRQIAGMITHELSKYGFVPEGPSNKQGGKETLSGRSKFNG